MDFLRFLSAIFAGGLIYVTARTDMPAAIGILGFYVMLSAGWSESRFERIMKAINANWGKNG